MVRTLLIVAALALLAVGIGIGTGYLHPPWEQPVETKPPQPPINAAEIGPFLFTADFPAIDPAAYKPRSEPILLHGTVDIRDKQEVPSPVAGQVLYIGEPVPDAVVEAVGAAAFMSEPYAYNVVAVGDTKHYKFYRRLLPGQMVRSEQMVGMIECSKALATLQEKLAKIQYAVDDEKAAKAAADEAKARADRDQQAYDRGALSAAELSASLAAREKFRFDYYVKGSAIKAARIDLDQAKILYHQHEIRSKVNYQRCVIQHIYKGRGDAVKDGETLMVVHSLDHLLATALVDGSLLDRIKPEMKATVEPTVDIKPLSFPSAHRGEVTAIAVTGDRRVVSAGLDKLVSVRDPVNGGLPVSLRHEAGVRAVICSPPDVEHNLCISAAGDKICVWDLDPKALGNGFRVRPVKVISDAHAGAAAQALQITSLAFSQDGKFFASGADDGSIALWRIGDKDPTLVYRFDHEHIYVERKNETDDQKLEYVLGIEQGHSDPVTSLAFTPQGRLVSASRDKSVRVWQLKEKGVVLDGDPITGRSGNIGQLGVRSDGKWLAYDNKDGHTIEFVSVEHPEIAPLKLRGQTGGSPFETVAIFSPDGDLLLTAGQAEGRMQLWKAPTESARGFEVRQFAPTEKRPVTCAAFAPRHGFAVSGDAEGDVYLWPLPTAEEIATHRIPNVPVRVVSQNLDPNTRQFRIAVDVENPASPQHPMGRLLPGRAVTIVIGEE